MRRSKRAQRAGGFACQTAGATLIQLIIFNEDGSVPSVVLTGAPLMIAGCFAMLGAETRPQAISKGHVRL